LVTSTGTFSVATTLTACTLGGLSGSYALGLTNATGAALSLSVGNNNSDTTFSGALSGSGSLKKIGSGKLTLAGVNSYTGATTVEAGTLDLGCDGALGTGTQITLNGGTLAAGSFANGLSALSVGASNGTIDVGDGSGALAFAGSSGQTWSGTLNITFTGEWNPYVLRFGTSPAGLSATQLGSLRVNGQKAWLMLDSQGYLWRLTGTVLRMM
jgi:autotransporter-associated beta strand protein